VIDRQQPALERQTHFNSTAEFLKYKVPNPLRLRPAPNRRETLPSFLSRLASSNGVGMVDFALDMGFSFKRIIEQEAEALRDLAGCGGLTEDQYGELLSWTGEAAENVQIKFRDEVFGSRSLRNPMIRGCPVCLRHDAETDTRIPLRAMTMRGDWQFREVSVCMEHKHPLVPLWERTNLSERHNCSARLTEILADIQNKKLEVARVQPSQFDFWLDQRISTGQDETWLADKSIYAASIFCRLLGTELLRLDRQSSRRKTLSTRDAQARGFAIARQGENAIKDALEKLAAHADGRSDEPRKAFGGLYVDLSSLYLDKPAFTVFRQILRSCILSVWPIAKGQEVLGVTHHERKLHSIHTASKETGVGPFLLEQFLVHAGALEQNDSRPLARRTFDANAHADLLAEIPTLVGPIEMRKAMGATLSQLKSLETDGVLVPRIDVPTIKSPWRLADGLALVQELSVLSSVTTLSDNRWEAIQRAKKRSKICVGAIITAIREGQLQLGRYSDVAGYAGFCVMKSEIDELGLVENEQPDFDYITLAAFGRSVGMRDRGWFKSLVDGGHTPATRILHPTGDREQLTVSTADAAEFHKRFFTAATMEKEFGVHRRTLLAKLRSACIGAFTPGGQDFGKIYLREDVEIIFGIRSNNT
jgi:hypothetical protein